jgi:hypothetical protein
MSREFEHDFGAARMRERILRFRNEVVLSNMPQA